MAEPDLAPLAHRRIGAGPPLVLLHPLALSGRVWEPVWEDFATEREVIAVDLRGHGDSPWDGKAYGVQDLADDVVHLLDGLGVEKFALLGLSMGGSVATVLAATYPERVTHLVLCDTTAWYGPKAVDNWAIRARQAAESPRPRQIPFQTDRWFNAGVRATSPEIVAHTVRTFLRTEPRAHAEACKALGALDARAALSSITAATLVVTGEEDQATPPKMGKALADGIAGARFEVWPGLRHLSVLESSALRAEVLSHLRGTSTDAGTSRTHAGPESSTNRGGPS